MIGGQDVIIPTNSPLAAIDLAVRTVKRLWPSAVLEDGETGEVLQPYREMRLAGRREILAFKDIQASKRWADVGADDSTKGTLIHLLVSPGELTVVVDDEPSPEMKAYVRTLCRALTQDLFADYAVRTAA